MILDSATISGADLACLYKCQRHLHGDDFEREPSAVLIAIRGMVLQNDSCLLLYGCEAS